MKRRYAWDQRIPDSPQVAVTEFTRALELDPTVRARARGARQLLQPVGHCSWSDAWYYVAGTGLLIIGAGSP